MITDVAASKLFLLLDERKSAAEVARRLGMSEKTVRKYREADRLPSQIGRPERTGDSAGQPTWGTGTARQTAEKSV